MNVIATNVTRLPEDNREPARYRHRIDGWRRLKEPRKKAAAVDGL